MKVRIFAFIVALAVFIIAEGTHLHCVEEITREHGPISEGWYGALTLIHIMTIAVCYFIYEEIIEYFKYK